MASCVLATAVVLMATVALSGGWGSWSSWGHCSLQHGGSCGYGYRHRSRQKCEKHGWWLGEKTVCSTQWDSNKKYCTICCKVNCSWNNWGSWGSCSKSCGSTGTQTRRRTKSRTESCGGTCSGSYTSTRSCYKCCKVNCSWNSWGSWGSCSKSCGSSGTQTRKRTKSRNESCGGTCSGSSTSTRSCPNTCCKVNCAWNSWGSWGSCSKTCGSSGTQTRKRTKSRTESCGGSCSGSSSSSRSCPNTCCPRDCRYNSWASWSSCDYGKGKTCGTGSQSRSRSYSQTEYCGGKSCSGPSKETKSCSKCCPRDCQYGNWSSWSPCNVASGHTCGAGDQSRTREIIQREYCDGKPCIEPLNETRTCHKCCPVDCFWRSWGKWSACSKSCGPGVQTRTRSEATSASCGGKPCPGSSKATRSCSNPKKNCTWNKWGKWGSCSKSCGSDGIQTRNRTKRISETCGGICSGNYSSTQSCPNKCCPRDCRYGNWSSWTPCDFGSGKTCGSGSQSRSRDIIQAMYCGGKRCSGSPKETKSCSKCCPRDCKYGSWSKWSKCNYGSGKTCGTGSQSRSRKTTQTAHCGGKACNGPPQETQSCSKCCPRDCLYGNWSSWSSCNYGTGKTCGSGSQTRSRSYAQTAYCGGKRCSGPAQETRSCSKCCPKDCQYGNWSKWSKCNYGSGKTCGSGSQSRTRKTIQKAYCGGKSCSGPSNENRSCSKCCPRDCRYGNWSSWSPCDYGTGKNCGSGKQSRSRKIAEIAICGGKACRAPSKETKSCSKCCPKDCRYGSWSKWSKCNYGSGKTCGSGSQSRTRKVTQTAYCGGKSCSGPSNETHSCSKCCPRDCQYGNWSTWSSCDYGKGKTCGSGKQSRSRTFVQTATCGGKPCSGPSKETKSCSKCCSQDCRYGSWSKWSQCDYGIEKTCGSGNQTRSRKYSQTAYCGGKPCDGKDKETRECYQCCPVNCEWKNWESWCPCSRSCNSGVQSRSRDVARKASCGGKPCAGPSKDTSACNTQCCPKDCTWSKWSAWSRCTKSCDGGIHIRTRRVSNVASCGGKCSGEPVEQRPCNQNKCP